MPRKPLTEEEKSVVRKKACVAARRIMDQHGPEKVTIRGIAREIGMSAMSLYTYFESKADILVYLQTQAVEDLVAELAAAGATETEPDRVLGALGAAYIGFATEKPDEFRLAFRPDAPGAAMPAAARESLDAALEPLREAVRGMVKEARSSSEVERIVAAIWSAWHGYAVLKQAGCVNGETPGVDLRTIEAAFRNVSAACRTAQAGAH